MNTELKPVWLDVLTMAREILDDAGMHSWRLAYTDEVPEWLGVTNHSPFDGGTPYIAISRPWLNANPLEAEETVLHELAHAMVGVDWDAEGEDAHHGPNFYVALHAIGGTGNAPQIVNVLDRTLTYFVSMGLDMLWNLEFPAEVNHNV